MPPFACRCFFRRIMLSIYLDNNASTPVLTEVWEAMRPFAVDSFGNPASSHHSGRRARQALESARERTAAQLGAHPTEVVFTSGATEANNLALYGLVGEPPAHLIASPIEHPCVTEPLQQLKQRGFQLDFLPVNELGVVELDELESLIQPATRLVTLMLANHETGALQPVDELASRLADRALLHCDAAAAAGKVIIDFHRLGADTLTISAPQVSWTKGCWRIAGSWQNQIEASIAWRTPATGSQAGDRAGGSCRGVGDRA